MDLITDLPESNGMDSILSVVDHGLTKGVILLPCKKTVTADGIAKLLLDNLYKRFGLPDKIISDRDPRFAARAFLELLKLLGIKSALSTAYHPQSDGTTERFNQEIEAYLSIFCISHPDTWTDALPTLEFTHNNRKHSDRPYTPFQLIMGTSPTAIPTSFERTKFPAVQERLENIDIIRQEAIAAHTLARLRMSNRIRSTFTPFKKGDRVWLEAKNLKLGYNKKISTRREGPFKIEKVLGPVTYQLKLPPHWKIHDVFHATLLSPYRENEIYGEHEHRPPPDLIEGEEEYEVERIVKHRKRGRNFQYLVKWKGYADLDSTWETEKSFTNAQDILKSYKKTNKLT